MAAADREIAAAPETATDVNAVTLLSPQLIVPLKSPADAPALASLNVAVSVLLVTPSVPFVALAMPAVSGASFTCAVPLMDVLLPPTSFTRMLIGYVPSSAQVYNPRCGNLLATLVHPEENGL